MSNQRTFTWGGGPGQNFVISFGYGTGPAPPQMGPFGPVFGMPMPGAVPGGGLHGDDNLNMFINQLIQLSTQGFMNDDVLRRVIEESMNDRYGPPPASEDAISSLAERTLADGDDVIGKDCHVCMDEFKAGDDVTAMPCEHLFHKACLRPWLDLHNTCPLCRAAIPARDRAAPRPAQGTHQGGPAEGSGSGLLGGLGSAVGAGLSWLANHMAGSSADVPQNQSQQPPEQPQGPPNQGQGQHLHTQTFTYSTIPSSSNQQPNAPPGFGFPFAGLFNPQQQQQHPYPGATQSPGPSLPPGFPFMAQPMAGRQSPGHGQPVGRRRDPPVTVPIPIDRDQYNAVAALPVAELKADIHQRGGTTDGCVEKSELVRRYFEVVVPGAVIDPAIESSPIVQRANERVEMSAIGPAANAVTQGGGAVGSADQPIATADSMDVDQPEGGTLNLLELRAPAVARAPIASVPPEPDAGDTDTSLVAVRLPNGSRLSRRWRNDSTLAHVYAYVAKETGRDPGSFELVLPTHALHGMDSSTTVLDAGLSPRGLVVCKEVSRAGPE